MNQQETDKGLVAVLVKRLETERLPRMKEMKAKVDDGGVLDDSDITFMKQVFDDAHRSMDILKRNPDYAKLAMGVIQMYQEIMDKSQANSK